MNSTGQSFGANPLFNSTESYVSGGAVKPVSSTGSVDNALNNKEFSDVLDKQTAHDKVAASGRVEHAGTDSLTTDIAAIDPAEIITVEADSLLMVGEGGKPLPEDGFSLPLAADTVEQPVINATTVMFATDELPVMMPGQQIEAETKTESLLADSKPVSLAVDQGNEAAVPLLSPESSYSNPVTVIASGPVGVELAAVAGPVNMQVTAQSGQPNRNQGGNSTIIKAASAQAQTTVSASVLSADMDVDGVKATAGAITHPAQSANVLPELAAQFQIKSPLAEAVGTLPGAELGLTNTSTETTPALNNLLASAEAPQAYRNSAATTFQTAVPVEVGKPGWSDTVMQRVMWMSSQNINKAEIALDPPELGPLQVRISTQGEHTTVSFTSQHGSVREALDQGLPRLREMMDGQGLNLADVDVSDQQKQQSQRNEADAGETAATGMAGGEGDAILAEEEISSSHQGMSTLSLIDQYV